MPAKQAEGAVHTDLWNCLPEHLTVETNKASPFYDERVELPPREGLVKSIMKRGVIKPVIVIRDGERLVVDDGRQRVRCCIEANNRLSAASKPVHKVGYIIKRVTDGDVGIIGMSAAANIHVEDPPMARARKVQRMLDAGASKEDVADDFDVTVPCIENWLTLLDCTTAVQDAVEDGTLAESAARDLAGLDRAKQKTTFEKMVAEGTTKGAEAKRAVSAVKKGKEVPKKSTARRMKNRTWLQDVYDRLEAKEGALKKDAQAVCAFARLLLGYRASDKNQCDDVAEVLDEIADAKKPAGRPKKQREAA